MMIFLSPKAMFFSMVNATRARLSPVVVYLFGALLCGVFGVGVFGTAYAATPTFPLDKLKAGQTGYALTAVAKNRIERFKVEVLALQYDAGAGFPLVLVRAGGRVIEEAGGIASGMSGSPVYLSYGGKDALLGAISFTFPESTGGLGLVTPVATMRRTGPDTDSRTSSNPERKNPAYNSKHKSPQHKSPQHRAAAFGPKINFKDAAPVRTPLLLSGVSARASTFLGPLLAEGLEPLTLPTNGYSQNGYVKQDRAFVLQPGSAVSVQLVRGDITVAAVGTLTLIEDGAFWAFGHPLLGGGAASFALAPAYVTALVPSRTTPFKLADSGRRVLGSVTQDRPYAISGRLGRAPKFIPITLNFSGDAGALRRRFEVTEDERLYAPLLASATLQAFDELLEARRGGTAELAWDLTLKGGRRVRALEQTASPDDVAFAAAQLAAEPLAIFADNPFRAAEVERLAMSVRFERAQREAELVKVVPERKMLKVGEALFLNVRLQPYRADPVVERVKVRLPSKLRGTVTLTVRGGATPADGGGDLRPLLSFAELLAGLETNVQASELVVEVRIDGEPRLLTRLSLPYLVSGSEAVELEVRGPKPAAKPRKPGTKPDSKPGNEPEAPEVAPDLPETEPRDGPLEEPPLEPSLNLGFTDVSTGIFSGTLESP